MARGGRARRPPADARRRLALDHLACRASCAHTFASPPPLSRGRTPSCKATAGVSPCSPTASSALEWSEDGAFEDRASTFALHRDLPVPEFDVIDGEGTLEIVTDRLRLTYDRGPFTPAGLSVQARGNISNHHSVWRYGEPVERPRRHHAHARRRRRADRARSRHRLAPAVSPRSTTRARSCSTDDGWVSPRPDGGIDVYVFAYGHDYQAALDAFFAVSGRPPVLPRWVLGNWWSRYHRYSADSYLELLDRFEEERPAVLRRGAGHGLAPRRVGAGALRLGLDRLQLGAGALPRPRGLPHRAAPPRPARHAQRPPRRRRARLRGRLPAMAEALGRDASTDEPIAFDITDRAFLDAYLEVLHHPLEDAGRRLLVARLAAGHLLAHPGHRPAMDAQPLPLPRLRPRRPPPADVLALRRPGQPPLPDRLLRRHAHLVGVARLPARVHRDRVERRLRLVEPRRRRPHPRHPRRRARHPLGAARPVLADPAAALVEQPVPGQGAVAVPARGARRDGRRAALPPPARALPAHHEPPRVRPTASRSCGRCTTSRPRTSAPTTCRTSSRSAPSCWSRRSPRHATR